MKKTKRPRPEENPRGDDLDDFGLRLEDRVEAVNPKATEIIPEDATLPEAKQEISKPKKKRRQKVCLGHWVATWLREGHCCGPLRLSTSALSTLHRGRQFCSHLAFSMVPGNIDSIPSHMQGTSAGEVAKDIGVRTRDEQAQWLYNSFAASTGASILEQSWLEGEVWERVSFPLCKGQTALDI